MTITPVTQGRQHLPVLDGVRAIAVLIVIVFHFWQDFYTGPYDWMSKVAVWGSTGVDLFFVLSGFLITRILLESSGSSHFLRDFYMRRVLRIFPLYYCTILILFVALPLVGLSQWIPWNQSLWYVAYLQNVPATFAPHLVAGPSHLWSLAVEEEYYLFWPLLILLLPRVRLLSAAGAMIVLSILFRVTLTAFGNGCFRLLMLDGLAIGSALAIIAREHNGSLANLVRWAGVILVVGGPALVVAQTMFGGHAVAMVQVTRRTLVGVVYASVLVLVVENRLGAGVHQVLSGPLLRSVGKYSYAMYVLHPFVLNGLHRAGAPYGVGSLLLTILLTYLAAWISWVVLEERMLRWKTRFAAKPAANPVLLEPRFALRQPA